MKTKPTDDLIRKLAAKADVIAPPDREAIFLLKWSLLAALAVTLWLTILPLRADLNERSTSLRFVSQSTLWLGLATLGGLVAYRSRLPGASTRRPEAAALLVAAALVTDILWHSGSSGPLAEEFHGEMSFWRGRCGPLIFFMALSWAFGAWYWVSRGAPTMLIRSAVWVAVSSGALGAFTMQFICAHENSLHLVIWHFVPVALLMGLGAHFGRRFLRW